MDLRDDPTTVRIFGTSEDYSFLADRRAVELGYNTADSAVRCLCGHAMSSHGRFYGRTWSDHCRSTGCTCKGGNS